MHMFAQVQLPRKMTGIMVIRMYALFGRSRRVLATVGPLALVSSGLACVRIAISFFRTSLLN